MKKRGPYKAKPLPGSFADLAQAYRQSPRFLGWAPATKRKNDKIIGDFIAANGRAMVASLGRGDLIRMRDSMAATPSEAKNWLAVIRGMLDYAVDLEMVPFNVAARVKPLERPNPDGYRTWREDEIEAFLRFYPVDTMAHRALVLMLYTGASRVDVVRLGPGNVQDGRIVYRRQKTRKRHQIWVTAPILPPLQAVLDAIEGAPLTFLQTAAGTMRSEKSLTGQMALWVSKVPGLSEPNEHGRRLNCHGLRKAMGRRLAEAGCTPHEIQAILGHADLKQVMTYTQAYDRQRAADSAAEKLGARPAGNVVRIGKNGA